MDNLLLFLDGFVEYLVVFFVFILAISVAIFIGIKLRKVKNNKISEEADKEETTDKLND